ncbi:hypothetical protein HPC38_09320 [Pasteurellaceae bacterium HPA106]|uniref:hypothetical protein n=1 Tax=Spirabiliibacterium pneumoniae TaxID=221400 RepID=UPI001AAD708F|nr:hypothetical protein [Spirabiliibacterium pneumoniae]MBE2897069.1 hypothetical protein [Spirabiliibacterium pneumoniae]
MKKAITLGLTTLLLTGCGSNFMNYSSAPKYKVTDNEAFFILGAYYNGLACIYPKIKNKTYNQAQELISNMKTGEKEATAIFGMFFITSTNTIGTYKTNIIINDPNSFNYLRDRFFMIAGDKLLLKDYKNCPDAKKRWNELNKLAATSIKERKNKELAQKRQAEKEEKARQAFYSTPQGQAYLAQQRMLAQQQAMQQRAIAQRNAELEAQRRYAEMQALNNSMAELNNTIQRTNQNNMNMYNQMNQYNQMQQMNRSLNNINNSLQNMGGGSGIRWNNVY